jgi:hypothetical protein
LTVAAVLEAVEGAAALAFGLFVGWETLFGEPFDPASAIGVTILACLGGAALLAVAYGLLRVRRWSLAPAVLTQLLALYISWNLLRSDQPLYGVPLVACAIIMLILLFSRASTAALHDE